MPRANAGTHLLNLLCEFRLCQGEAQEGGASGVWEALEVTVGLLVGLRRCRGTCCPPPHGAQCQWCQPRTGSAAQPIQPTTASPPLQPELACWPATSWTLRGRRIQLTFFLLQVCTPSLHINYDIQHLVCIHKDTTLLDSSFGSFFCLSSLTRGGII